MDGLLNGGVIALPPIINFGTPEQRAKFVPDILAGKKYISLAISEAFAGSDVNGAQTVAVRDGDEWVVTGTKKYACMVRASSLERITHGRYRWITNGTFSDYFTTLCKTDVCLLFCWSHFEFLPPLQAGFVVLLVERSDAVSTKPVKTSYSSTAGTAFVTFDKARVPVSNTLGQVGKGISIIFSNFNHERWMVTASSLGAQRLVVEECLK